MSLALSLPKRLKGRLKTFFKQPNDGLSPELRALLDHRPNKPFRGAFSGLTATFLTNPYPALLLLQHALPRFQSITDRGSLAFVHTHRDITNVLDRDDDFPSGPVVGPAMVCGDFVLGTDRVPLYRQDLTLLWQALYGIPPEELQRQLPASGPGAPAAQRQNWPRFRERFQSLVDSIGEKVRHEIAEARRRDGKLDLVKDVLRPVCVELVIQRYFGIGPQAERWHEVVWDVLQSIAMRIILPYNLTQNVKTDPVIKDLNWAGDTLKQAIHEAIADARRHPEKRNTLVERLHAVVNPKNAPLSHEDRKTIVRNVAGLAVTGCHPVAKAAAQAVNILLTPSNRLALEGTKRAARKAIDAADRTNEAVQALQEEVEAAVAGARVGVVAESPEAQEVRRAIQANWAPHIAKLRDEQFVAEEQFWSFIYEALRFFPPFPLVNRACPRDTSISNGEDARRKIRGGQTVVVGLLPAMFDEDAVPFPHQFRTDRAPKDSLVFGRGMHACFGFQLAREILVAMLMPLFAEGIEGDEGKLSFDLLAVKSYPVRLSCR